MTDSKIDSKNDSMVDSKNYNRMGSKNNSVNDGMKHSQNDGRDVVSFTNENNQVQSYEKLSYEEFVEKEDKKLAEAEKRFTSK